MADEEGRAVAEARAASEARVAAFDGATWLWFLQLVLALAATFVVLSRQWSIDRCGLECDFGLLVIAGNVFLIIAGAALLASALALTLVRALRPRGARRRPRDRWIPLAGIVVTVVAAVVAYWLSSIAVLLA